MTHKEKSEYKGWNSHRIKFADFFKRYPYPFYDIKSNTVPMNPYIPKRDVVADHEHSLSKKEWQSIIRCYLKYLKQYIINGYMFKIPHNLGYLFLIRYKTRSKIDWVETRKRGKLVRFKNDHTDGYSVAIKWKRSNAPWSMYWKIEPIANFRKDIGEALNKNYSLINNYTK